MSEPTLHTAIIGTTQVYGIRELNDMQNVATFDAGYADASIDPTTIRFVNDANKLVRELQIANPLEAAIFIPKTSGYGLMVDSKYAIDYRTKRDLSAVECEAQIFRLAGAPNFEKSAQGVSITLLKQKLALVDSDFRNVPYVLESRKRILELAVLSIQILQIQKSIFDEIFKLVNIVSDILSGAAIITIPAGIAAILNLIRTLINLGVLIQKTIQLIVDNRELFFPPIRYHKGINLYQYLEKATQFLGLELQMGNELTDLCKMAVLVPSKNDEVGTKTMIPTNDVDLFLSFLPDIGDGLLRPSDFGYTFGEAIDLVKMTFNARSAIKNGVYHLRAKKDPFWLNAPSYVIPDVLIEQALNQSNGYTEYNYEEIVSRYLISWAKDETDYHTLTDTNNRMAEVIYDHPITDRQRSLLKGITEVNIPYALCVRKKSSNMLFSLVFERLVEIVNSFQDEIQQLYAEFPQLEAVAAPILDQLGLDAWISEGAILVENHFFGTPKFVILNEDGRIPLNFESSIGANALWHNWHSFNSMAPGWKNISNPSESNQKIIFREVKIPFGIEDWNKTIINSNCTVPGYGRGEFLNIKWSNGHDFATADFFAYRTFAPNLTGTLYVIAPNNVPLVPPYNPGW